MLGHVYEFKYLAQFFLKIAYWKEFEERSDIGSLHNYFAQHRVLGDLGCLPRVFEKREMQYKCNILNFVGRSRLWPRLWYVVPVSLYNLVKDRIAYCVVARHRIYLNELWLLRRIAIHHQLLKCNMNNILRMFTQDEKIS